MVKVPSKIISFGESLIDLFGSALDQSYISRKYDLRLGGGAAIFAIACQRFGFQTSIITSFSNDSFGQFLYKIFEIENVNLSYTGLVEEKTPLVFINSTKDYSDYKFYGNNFGVLEIPYFELDNNYLEQAKVFHFTSFALMNDNNYNILLKYLKKCKEKDITVFLNFNLRSRLKKTPIFFKRVFEVLDYVDIIISNILDYEQIFDSTDLNVVLKEIFKFNIQKAIITYGRKGARLYTSETECLKTLDDFRVTAVDSTGAGSIFAASFICSYLDSRTDLDSINTAHKMAAISTTKKGAIDGIPTKEEIKYIHSDQDLLDTSEQNLYALSTMDKKNNKNYFSNFVKQYQNSNPLILTQKPFSKTKKYFKKNSDNIIYVTKSPRNKLSYLPIRLEQLFFIINLYSIKTKQGIVLLDCLDILFKNNPSNKVFNFLYQISNLSLMGSIRFIVILDYDELDEDQKIEFLKLKLLTNKDSEFSSGEGSKEMRTKYLKSHIGENLVDVKDKNELYRRVKDILKDVYGYSHVNIYELDKKVLINSNKHAKRRFIHLNKNNIFKDCMDNKSHIVINKVEDDIYYSKKNRSSDVETISALYFENYFNPTILIPFGKEEAVGLVEISSRSNIEVNSEEFKEVSILIKNAFFLGEIFILKGKALESSKKMKQLDLLKNNFLSMISHELRTPLTSIKGYSSILRNEKLGPLNDVQKNSLKILEKETSNLTVIINDLLDISKIESGKLDLYKSNENIKDVIIDSIQIMEGFAKEKEVIIDFTKSIKFILQIDSSRIHQVLTNLINNAIKFSDPNTTIRIEMEVVKLNVDEIKKIKTKFQVRMDLMDSSNHYEEVESEREYLLIRIVDQGCGIENKNIPLLFDKFFQISNNLTRRIGGTGLGLSIVKHLIELHDGLIDVKSDFNEGSAFSIFLPTD